MQRKQDSTQQPLWPAATEKNKIVVVSDLHFAVQDQFSRNVKNVKVFTAFLQRLQQTADVKEVVINGDFLDAWALPLQYLVTEDMGPLYRRIMGHIPGVFTALKDLIAAGINVVYLPGNHDMDLGRDILAAAVPGIVQPGDGRYTTGARNEIMIEHGHRYDPYSAPDSISNHAIFGRHDMAYPPGYFYSRLHTSRIREGKPGLQHKYPLIGTVSPTEDSDKMGAYIHAKTMAALFQMVPVKEAFEEKVFPFRLAGETYSYSVQDIYPVMQADGSITSPILFRDFQRTWHERQDVNHVWVRNSFTEAGAMACKPGYYRYCAERQYLENKKKPYEIAVFGHTHVPELHENGQTCYINTGTWIDENRDYSALTRTFAVIETGAESRAGLYIYDKDAAKKIAAWPST